MRLLRCTSNVLEHVKPADVKCLTALCRIKQEQSTTTIPAQKTANYLDVKGRYEAVFSPLGLTYDS